jgi:hypothetical protein
MCVRGGRAFHVVAVQLVGYKQVVLRELITPTFLQIILIFDEDNSNHKLISVFLRRVIW